jgi:hypothetical protein
MVSANRIYRTMRQTLPSIVKETAKIFDAYNFNTEISWSNLKSSPDCTLTSLTYFPRERKLKFIWKEATEEFHSRYKTYSKYLREISLRDISTLLLAHEVPHNAHDFVTNFEMGKERLEMILEFPKKKDIRAQYCLSAGIIEGIANYARQFVLENLGRNELRIANENFCNKTDKKNVQFLGDLSTEDALGRIESESDVTDKLFPFITLTDFYYRQKFGEKGLESFRDFVRNWRPSQETRENTIDTFGKIIEYAKNAKFKV